MLHYRLVVTAGWRNETSVLPRVRQFPLSSHRDERIREDAAPVGCWFVTVLSTAGPNKALDRLNGSEPEFAYDHFLNAAAARPGASALP